ncbi:response regulator transcription factor [Bradyrhizobium sp. HKCCYLR20261]|uniref:response regulator transcription factor n=1 Tax=Bradyrhizobium sp. HKCCYLR20261 TaxID=3420760 RepID=UPI003EBA0F9E
MTVQLLRQHAAVQPAPQARPLQGGWPAPGCGEGPALRRDEAEITRPNVVAIADDDTASKCRLEAALLSVGLEARWFASSARLLASGVARDVGCLVIDAEMRGDGGRDLLSSLRARNIRAPIIVTSTTPDVATAVRAMRSGALNFVVKPCSPLEMLVAIQEAVEIETVRQAEERATDGLRELASRLTPRETEVLMALDRGLVNKQIATELGISLITVKMHRSNAFKKLGARSVIDMVQKVRDLELGRS